MCIRDRAGRICIVISDSTRAVPTKIILEALLSEMENCSIKKEQITILIATGLHRPDVYKRQAWSFLQKLIRLPAALAMLTVFLKEM